MFGRFNVELEQRRGQPENPVPRSVAATVTRRRPRRARAVFGTVGQRKRRVEQARQAAWLLVDAGGGLVLWLLLLVLASEVARAEGRARVAAAEWRRVAANSRGRLGALAWQAD